ncbi:MAG TPA: peptide chain release factor-like protein [Verrucomicrobiae bacterium]|nr:peptide chain release factor-like protein [Verrucomicrobiae bacterium]
MGPDFPVREEKKRKLLEMMAALGIREEDLEETFIRSSGSGGQHVNKTSTCVRLLHRPSGIEVKCMKERSQALNRFLARRELVERLASGSGTSAREEEIRRIRKKKAQKRRRSGMKYGDGE